MSTPAATGVPVTPTSVAVTLASLHVYPVKSCAGVTLEESLLIETGLEFDRAWMVVGTDGKCITQRELPRMALISTALKYTEVVLRAPGMLPLHLALDTVEERVRVRVWDDEVPAYDMGRLAAQWLSDFLGQPVRLTRFDPEHKRLSSKAWTGTIDAENAFSDGFPLLVASTASLADLNARLAQKGEAPVTMARFRPNLVLSWDEGPLDAYAEDHIDELSFDTPEGPVRLKLVKPCARCSIPSVDPATGVQGTEPGGTLAGYRADPRVGGGATFGVNAVIVEGIECSLRAGQAGRATLRW